MNIDVIKNIQPNTPADYAQLEAYFGLSPEVKFCATCVLSNQRPSATVESQNHNRKKTVAFDDNNVCSACRFHDLKYNKINWSDREDELRAMLDRFRSKNGEYDVIVPGSGGKDSFYVAHKLKHEYGMNPLTVTWPPHMYTEIGRKNFIDWLKAGFANISFHPNQDFHRKLTRAAFLKLCHPFQPFIIGQKMIGAKIAQKYGVSLIMYGESQAEGGGDISEGLRPTMKPKYYSRPADECRDIVLGGVHYDEWIENGATHADLAPYVPISEEDATNAGIEVHNFGYYHCWRPQDNYYYAVEHGGFEPNPVRTEGTYSKYSSLDDKIDGFHYYTTYIKFGLGRATYDASQEIRNGHLTREEGVLLVRKYDGEFPKHYFGDFLEYCDIDEDTFWNVIDKNRSPHLWRKNGNDWVLRHEIS